MRIVGTVFVSVAVVLTLVACTAGESTPSPQPTFDPSTLSKSDRAAIAAQLKDAADTRGIDNPPAVAIVRLASQSEYPQTMLACLRSAGFKGTLTADGSGWSVESTSAQQSALSVAEYTCIAKYPLKPDETGPLTAKQKKVVYTYVTKTLVSCLADQGITVPDSEIPSEATFLGGFEDNAPWNPYPTIWHSGYTSKQLDKFEAACPPNTPPDLLYGD